MSFFDTHTHLDYLQRDSGQPLSRLVENAAAAGVEKILIMAVMAADFENILKMTALYPSQLYCGLGLHPLHIRRHKRADLNALASLLASKPQGCVALGEIGLERGIEALITPELWRAQCELLEAQLQLAKDNGLPVSLHSRKAHEQLFPFLKRAGLSRTGVVHGFSGSYEQAKRFIDLGYKIGVGGVISYARAQKTRATVQRLPLDALVLETDAPDMPLFGFQGAPNRPERLSETFKFLSALRSEPAELIAATLWRTSCDLFAAS
ncbi:TatD family hydrolase [Mesocricetibacter intestinalis]|nr:TatD family hydrolase [Mesocricetibacter intestinalis]